MNGIQSESDRNAALAFVLHGHRKDSDALGFIPRAAIERYADLNWISFGHLNDELCSFCVFGIHKLGLKIYQIWTVPDCRRLAAAAAVLSHVHAVASAAGKKESSAWVAEDLLARYFWEEMGYQLAGLRSGGNARGRIHLHFKKSLVPSSPLSASESKLLQLIAHNFDGRNTSPDSAERITWQTHEGPLPKIVV